MLFARMDTRLAYAGNRRQLGKALYFRGFEHSLGLAEAPHTIRISETSFRRFPDDVVQCGPLSSMVLKKQQGPDLRYLQRAIWRGRFFGIYGLGPDLAYISASLRMLILALMAS